MRYKILHHELFIFTDGNMAAVRCSSFVGYRCGKLVLRSCRQFSGQAARRGLARDIRTAGVVVTVASVAGYAAYRAVNGKSLIGHESVKVFAKVCQNPLALHDSNVTET